MRNFIFVLVLAPLMAFASENNFQPATQKDDVIDSSRCAGRSDMYCYGKPVGAICIRDPQPPYGSSGLCRPRGRVDNNRQTTCLCR